MPEMAVWKNDEDKKQCTFQPRVNKHKKKGKKNRTRSVQKFFEDQLGHKQRVEDKVVRA